MEDISFDSHIDRFRRNIELSHKGRIRRAVIDRYLRLFLPELYAGKKLKTADVGGGFGRFSTEAAALGHEVVYTDLSTKMMEEARARAEAGGVAERITFHCSCFREVLQPARYDVLNCQAVLEWLAAPEEGLTELMQAVRPGGHLVLLFYNRESVVLRNLIRGNFYKVESDDYRGDGKGLTPMNPLPPESVYTPLAEHGFQLKGRAGIRTFSDLCFPHVDIAQRLDDVIRLESEFAGREPYISIARYILVVAQAPS